MTKHHLEFVPQAQIFQVPSEIAVCPYCQALLIASVSEWSEESDETKKANQIDVDCDSEPDIESPEWNDWLSSHSKLPYIYWMPIVTMIEDWINQNFRFY